LPQRHRDTEKNKPNALATENTEVTEYPEKNNAKTIEQNVQEIQDK